MKTLKSKVQEANNEKQIYRFNLRESQNLWWAQYVAAAIQVKTADDYKCESIF